MKKITTFIIAITLFMLFPITSKALNKVNLAEDSNGKLNTTLHFEEGFIGGIDLKLKIAGNVTVKDLSFNNKIKENNYTANYDYDAKNKTLEIKIVTGGRGSTHNLLNAKKELLLGIITLSTNAKENVKYSFSVDSLTIIDNNLDSQNISKEDITFGDTSNFTYVVNKEEVKEETKKEEDSKEESKKEENTITEDNNSSDGKSDNINTNNNKTNSDKNNPTTTNNNNTNNEEEKDEQKEQNEQDDKTDINDNQDNNEKNEISKKNKNVYWILGTMGGLLVLTIIIVYVIKKKKV